MHVHGQKLIKDDLIGKTIRGVYGCFETRDDLDYASAYFVLDDDITFELPVSLDHFLCAGVPTGAELYQRLPDVFGRRISAVFYTVWDDGKPRYGSAALALDDGRLVFHEPAAPNGVSGAGIYVCRIEDVGRENLRDFFDEPAPRDEDVA